MSSLYKKYARVIAYHHAQYPDPIRVAAAEPVQVGRADPEFPGLNLPPEEEHRKVSFHLEARPEGGFKVHYSNPNSRDPAHAEGDFLFGEKMVNLMGRYLTPEVLEKLRQKALSGKTGSVNE